MATVQVLCPNGRRQNVKTTPNTKLLQVLEDVCQKQGFLPADDYGLIHGRKQLDLSLSIRYANIANNAKLELVKAQTSRAVQDVRIALQLENGQRLQEKFDPQTSLWDILLHWENQPDSPHKGELTKIDTSSMPPIQPVCIYMREEVIGSASLKGTSLRKLGLTSGNAVIRLTHRAVEDSVMADIADKLEKEKAKKAKLESMANRQASAPEKKQVTPPVLNSDLNSVKQMEEMSERVTDSNIAGNTNNESPEPMEVEPSSSKSAIGTVTLTQGEQAMEEESGATCKLDTQLHAGTVETKDDSETVTKKKREGSHSGAARPGQSSSESIRPGQSSTESIRPGRSSSGSLSAAESLKQMNIPGVEVFTPQDFLELSPEEQRVAKKLVAAYAQQARQQTTVSFADFKFPEETKGKDLYHNELSTVKREDFQPCDREMVLFNAVEQRSPSSPTSQDIPDEFFQVTEKDLRTMMVDLQKKAESDQPLMTQSLRELKQEEKYSKYEKAVIRIQFPDKLVVQGLFRPKETVFEVHKFVKGLLENKTMPFYLYTSPPKCVLKDQAKTLIQANLVPASLMYFGSDVVKDHYLSEDIMKNIESKDTADDKLSKCLPGSTESYVTEPVSAGSAGASGVTHQDRPCQKQNTQSSTPREPGVPKWFKTGKK